MPSFFNALVGVQLILVLPATLALDIHDGDPNFLFVGNSYTSYNSLAETTASILKDGLPEWEDLLDMHSHNPPGRSFSRQLDELEDGSSLQGLLQTNPLDWKWVVLQDQSQVPGFWAYDDGPGSIFGNSLNAAVELDDMVSATGGETMFFMTWGRRHGDNNNPGMFPGFLTMQDKITEGYMRYVKETSTSSRPTYVAPVGLVFQTIHNDLIDEGVDPTDEGSLFHQLYQTDGSHPTVAGTYVAALTIYTSMTGRSPKGINWLPDGLDVAVGAKIQDAVSRTVLETFTSGTIMYPWANAFPADGSGSTAALPSPTNAPTSRPPTRSPTTLSPTRAPRTPQPTRPPTPQPTMGNPTSTKGSITVEFLMDDYPSEISWTMVAEGDETDPMYFQPYESGVPAGRVVSETFDNLRIGNAYAFKASDYYNDGVCCSYGTGSLTIRDNVQNKVLFYARDYFQTYLTLAFEVLSNGHTQIDGKTEHYIPSTWEDLEKQYLPISNAAWPGLMPSVTDDSLTGSVMVNVMMDGHPEEVAWTIYRQTSYNKSWDSIYQFDGVEAQPNALSSTEISDLERGWYLFEITDSQENGLGSGGFVSLTSRMRPLQGDMGVAWGTDGFYYGQDQIYFRMERDGLLSYISWKPV